MSPLAEAVELLYLEQLRLWLTADMLLHPQQLLLQIRSVHRTLLRSWSVH